MADPKLASGGRPLLVGRAREQALDGHGSFVRIGGKAGIGKTALSESLVSDAATRGALVLVGHCFDLIETPPYGSWTEILDRYPPLPDLPLRPVLLGAAEPGRSCTAARHPDDVTSEANDHNDGPGTSPARRCAGGRATPGGWVSYRSLRRSDP